MGLYGSYDNQYGLIPTADMGGHKILGMNGSLTSYINTGDPYAADYYAPVNSKNKAKNEKAANNKQEKKLPTIPIFASLVAAGVGIYALIKTGKMKKIGEFCTKTFNEVSKKIKKAFEKTGQEATDKPKTKPFERLKKLFSKNNAENANKTKISLIDRLKKLCDKFKKGPGANVINVPENPVEDLNNEGQQLVERAREFANRFQENRNNVSEDELNAFRNEVEKFWKANGGQGDMPLFDIDTEDCDINALLASFVEKLEQFRQ